MGTREWFQRSGSFSFEFLLAEGDSVVRPGRTFFPGILHFVFSFQQISVFYLTVTFRFSHIYYTKSHRLTI